VKEALHLYRAAKIAAGQSDRASAAATLINRHLPAPLAATRSSELTGQILNEWLRARTAGARKGVPVLSQGTRDKLRGIMGAALRAAGVPDATLKTALNAAAASAIDGKRLGASAPHTILNATQISRLHAMLSAIDPDLVLLARALDETGSRPVQLLGATVNDLDMTSCMLHIAASAKGKPGSARRPGVSVPITPGLTRDLAAAAKANGVGGRLFTRPRVVMDPKEFGRWTDTGERTGWTKNVWVRPFREAVLAAGLPTGTTLYSLRHSHIVQMIQANIPLRIIASMCDTSTAMIEVHYSRWIARTAAAVDQVRRALRTDGVPELAA